jgi:hypothetical protein
MTYLGSDKSTVLIQTSLDELMLINNALNEVLHGMGVPECQTRLGAKRATAEELLYAVQAAMEAATPNDSSRG